MNFWCYPKTVGWFRFQGCVSCLMYVLLNLLSMPLDWTKNPSQFCKSLDTALGMQICGAYLLFMHFNGDQIMAIFGDLNSLNQLLMARGAQDEHIKRIRNYYFHTEMITASNSILLLVISTTLVFVQIACFEPHQLLNDFSLVMIIQPHSTYFWIFFVLQIVITLSMSIFLPLSMIMIGNVYNQLILNLEVLDYDIQSLDLNETLSLDEALAQFRIFTLTYLSIVDLLTRSKMIMRKLFLVNTTINIISIVLACTEFAIDFEEGILTYIRPLFYFLFLSFMLFYWCELGHRMASKVS